MKEEDPWKDWREGSLVLLFCIALGSCTSDKVTVEVVECPAVGVSAGDR